MNEPRFRKLKLKLRMDKIHIVRLELYEKYIKDVIDFVENND